MSSNKDEGSSAVIMVLAFVGAAIYVMLLFVFAFLVFLAFVFTLLSFLAWNEPLRLGGKFIITPDEARGFVLRGCIGAWAVPLFAGFCSLLFDVAIDWNYLLHMMVLGYTLGSIGVEIMMAQDDSGPSAPVQYLPPERQLPAPPPAPRPAPQRLPFRFASWDDEDGR